jgi:hypothetical protein
MIRFRRRLWLCVVAALALAGPARADGTGLLDLPWPGDDTREDRAFLSAERTPIEPDRLPPKVTRAAAAAVPGLKLREGALLRHRPITSWRVATEYSLKGRDAAGREVSVRTDEKGGQTFVTRAVPLDAVPAAELSEGKRFAARNGFTLTSALLVTRDERFLVRTSQHETYYLKGTHPGRPGVERFVWLCGRGLFRLRDLDDLMVRSLLLD